MDEDGIADRLKALRELSELLIMEIRESKEAIDLVNDLKKKYDYEKYDRLESWVNSKAWLLEVKEDLEDYYRRFAEKLRAKMENADAKTKAKIYILARLKLPPEMAEEFKAPSSVEIDLNPKNMAKLAKIDSRLFKVAKERMNAGEKTIRIHGEYVLKWLTME